MFPVIIDPAKLRELRNQLSATFLPQDVVGGSRKRVMAQNAVTPRVQDEPPSPPPEAEPELLFTHEGRSIPESSVRDALRMVESSGGTNAVPRYEEKYHNRMLKSYKTKDWIPTPSQRRIIKERGFDEATKIFSTSLGEYQILPETAYRYTSFSGNPEDLEDPVVAKKVLSELLSSFHKKGKGDLKDSLRYYNQGPEYFDKFMSYLKE